MADKHPNNSNPNHADYQGSSRAPHQISNGYNPQQNKPQHISSHQQYPAEPNYHNQSKPVTQGQNPHPNQGYHGTNRSGNMPQTRDMPPSNISNNPQQKYASNTGNKQSYQPAPLSNYQHHDKSVGNSRTHSGYDRGNAKTSGQGQIVNPEQGNDKSKFNRNTASGIEPNNKSYHGSMGNLLPNNPTIYHKSASQNVKRPPAQMYHGSVQNVHMSGNNQRKDYNPQQETSFSQATSSSNKYNQPMTENKPHVYQNQGYQHDQPYEKKPDIKEQYPDKNYRKEVQPNNSQVNTKSMPHSTHSNYQNNDKRMDQQRGHGYENRGYHQNENMKGGDKSEPNNSRSKGPSYHNHGSTNQIHRQEHPYHHSSTPHTTAYKDPNKPQQTGHPSNGNNYQRHQDRPDQPKNYSKNERYKSQEILPSSANQQYKSTPAPVAPQRSKNLSSSKPELNTQRQFQGGQQPPKNQYHPSSGPDMANRYGVDKKVTSEQAELNRVPQDIKSNSNKTGHSQYKDFQTNNQHQVNVDTQARERIHSDETTDNRKYEKRATQNMSNAPSARRRERIQSHQETGISGPIPKSYRNSNVPNRSEGFDPTPPTRTTSMGALNQIGQPHSTSVSNNPAGSMGTRSNLYRSTSVPAIAVTQESSKMYHRGSIANNNTHNGGLYKSQSILSLAMIQTEQTNLRRSASLASLVASNPNLARTASTYALYEMQVEKGIIPKDHQQTYILAIIATCIFPPISLVLGGMCLAFTIQNKPVWKTDLPRAIQTNTRLFWSSIGVIVFSICSWITIIVVVLLHHA